MVPCLIFQAIADVTVDETHLSGDAAVIIQLYAVPTCSTGLIRISSKQRFTLEQLHSSNSYVCQVLSQNKLWFMAICYEDEYLALLESLKWQSCLPANTGQLVRKKRCWQTAEVAV